MKGMNGSGLIQILFLLLTLTAEPAAAAQPFIVNTLPPSPQAALLKVFGVTSHDIQEAVPHSGLGGLRGVTFYMKPFYVEELKDAWCQSRVIDVEFETSYFPSTYDVFYPADQGARKCSGPISSRLDLIEADSWHQASEGRHLLETMVGLASSSEPFPLVLERVCSNGFTPCPSDDLRSELARLHADDLTRLRHLSWSDRGPDGPELNEMRIGRGLDGYWLLQVDFRRGYHYTPASGPLKVQMHWVNTRPRF